jgi:hypothetical protein
VGRSERRVRAGKCGLGSGVGMSHVEWVEGMVLLGMVREERSEEMVVRCEARRQGGFRWLLIDKGDLLRKGEAEAGGAR